MIGGSQMKHTPLAAGVAALALLGLAVPAPAFAARPVVDHWTDHTDHIEQEAHDDWCPPEIVPFDVRYIEDAWGTFRFLQHGDGLYYGGTSLKVEGSWTNVENGKTFSFVRSGADKDLKVTDNDLNDNPDDDGTITITGVSTGPTTYYDDSGKRLFVDTGRNFYTVVIDINGTPSNPDDDDFVEFLGADLKGNFQTENRDFCADIVEFIG